MTDDSWERLWPLADRLEALCWALDIRCPAWDRTTSRKIFLDELRTADTAELPESVSSTHRFFMAMEQEEFDEIYAELFNPWRTHDRQFH